MPTSDSALGCRIADDPSSHRARGRSELDRAEQPLPLETLEGQAIEDVVDAVGYVLDTVLDGGERVVLGILAGVANLVEDVDDVADGLEIPLGRVDGTAGGFRNGALELTDARGRSIDARPVQHRRDSATDRPMRRDRRAQDDFVRDRGSSAGLRSARAATPGGRIFAA